MLQWISRYKCFPYYFWAAKSNQKLPGGDCFRAWFARAVTQHQLLPGEQML